MTPDAATLESRTGLVVVYVIGIINRLYDIPHKLTESGWLRFAAVEDRFLSGDLELPTAEEILMVMVELDPSCTKDQMMDVCEEVVRRLNIPVEDFGDSE